MAQDTFPNHFENVREWLTETCTSKEQALVLLDNYKEQHEAPFSESNKAFAGAIILAIIFYFKFFGVELNIRVFEQNLIAIPNGLFVLPVVSMLSLAYAAVRAADAAYYQKMIEVIAGEALNDSQNVIARGYFGGGIISANFIDVWKTIPSRGFKLWFVALASTSGVLLTLLTMLPYAAGFTYIIWVQPEGPQNARLAQVAIMVIAEVAAIIAGIYALLANDLDNSPYGDREA